MTPPTASEDRAHPPGFVPTVLNPPGLMPAAAERIAFPRALLYFWIRPGRLGPHLAMGRLAPALGAHALTLVIATTAIAASIAVRSAPNVRSIEDIRALIAGYILGLVAVSGAGGWSGAWAYWVLLLIPGIQAALWLSAVVTMPFDASGDSIPSVWRRSLRIVYWATTALLPPAIAISVVVLCTATPGPGPGGFAPWISPRMEWPQLSDAGSFLFPALVIAAGLQFAQSILVAGRRYTGPAAGPGFEPREPRCERCGYVIVGLPLDGRCPECSEPGLRQYARRSAA